MIVAVLLATHSAALLFAVSLAHLLPSRALCSRFRAASFTDNGVDGSGSGVCCRVFCSALVVDAPRPRPLWPASCSAVAAPRVGRCFRRSARALFRRARALILEGRFCSARASSFSCSSFAMRICSAMNRACAHAGNISCAGFGCVQYCMQAVVGFNARESYTTAGSTDLVFPLAKSYQSVTNWFQRLPRVQ